MLSVAVIAGALFAPALTLAATKEELRAKNLFCSNIDAFKTRFDQRAETVYGELKEKRSTRLDHLSDYRTKQDTTLAAERKERDEEREAGYQKLAGRADTEEEREAVETFESTLETAVTTRRSAIDTAIKTSRDGLDRAIANHTNGVENAAEAFRNKTNIAFEKAEEDCAGNVDEATIRRHLRITLEEARKTFVSAVKEIEAFRNIEQSLKETREASVENAHEAFRVTADQAETDLKEAFGKD